MWIEFDEVTIIERAKWYYGDRVPGRFFKIERIEGNIIEKPEKLVVKRWKFDTDGDRIIFGDARAIWLPPQSQGIELTSGDPDFDMDAGVALYLSNRYNAFGVYRLSVWDAPQDMRFESIVNNDALDIQGEIVLTHNLGSELVNTAVYYEYNNRWRRVSPDEEWAVDENRYGFSFKSYVPFDSFFKILVERK